MRCVLWKIMALFIALVALQKPSAQTLTLGASDEPIQGHYQYWTTVSSSPSLYKRYGEFVITPQCVTLRLPGSTKPTTLCGTAVDRGDGDPLFPGSPWGDDGDWRIWAKPLPGYEDLIINSMGNSNSGWNNLIELEIKASAFPLSDHFGEGDVIRAYGWHVEDQGHSAVSSGGLTHVGIWNGGKTEFHPVIYLQKGDFEENRFKLFTAQDGSWRFPLAGENLENYFSGWQIPLCQNHTPIAIPVAALEMRVPLITQNTVQTVHLLKENAQVDVYAKPLSNQYISDDNVRTCWSERKSNIVRTQVPGQAYIQPKLKGMISTCLQPLYFAEFTRSAEQLLDHRLISHVETLPNGYLAIVADITATLRNVSSSRPFRQTEWRYHETEGFRVIKNPPGNSVAFQVKYSPTQGLTASSWPLDVMASIDRPADGWVAENLTLSENIGAAYRFIDGPMAHQGTGEAHHLYGRNSSGDLIHYYWSSAVGWAAENVTQKPGVGATFRFESTPIYVRAPGPGGVEHIYVRNKSGDLIHYYWSSAAGWKAENVTGRPNLGTAFRFVGAPLAIGSLGGGSQQVFVRNASGDLLQYNWDPTTGWSAENVTARYFGETTYRLEGNAIEFFESDNLAHVYGRNSSGELIHYHGSKAAGWIRENVTQKRGIGSHFRFVSDPDGLLASDGSHHVFARNADGDLIHYYWSSAVGWAAENVTQSSGIGATFRFESKPVAIEGADGAKTRHVFARNVGGDLIHFYKSGVTNWIAENATSGPDIGAAYQFKGEPVAISQVGTHVYARNASGDLLRYSWQNGPSHPTWRAENLTAQPGIGADYRFEGEPVAKDGNGYAPHVYVRNSNGEMVHYFYMRSEQISPDPSDLSFGGAALGNPETHFLAQARLLHFVKPSSIMLKSSANLSQVPGIFGGHTRVLVTGFDVEATVSLVIPEINSDALRYAIQWEVFQEQSAPDQADAKPLPVPIPNDGSLVNLDKLTIRIVNGNKLEVRLAEAWRETGTSTKVRVNAKTSTRLGENPTASTELQFFACEAALTPSVLSRWKDLEKVELAILKLKELGLLGGGLPSLWPRQLLQTWGDSKLNGPVYEWYPELPAYGKQLIDTFRKLADGQRVSDRDAENLRQALETASQLPDPKLQPRPAAISPDILPHTTYEKVPRLPSSSEVFRRSLSDLDSNQYYKVSGLEFDDDDNIARSSIIWLMNWSAIFLSNSTNRIDLQFVAQPGIGSEARALRRVGAVKKILAMGGLDTARVATRVKTNAGAPARGRLEIRLR